MAQHRGPRPRDHPRPRWAVLQPCDQRRTPGPANLEPGLISDHRGDPYTASTCHSMKSPEAAKAPAPLTTQAQSAGSASAMQGSDGTEAADHPQPVNWTQVQEPMCPSRHRLCPVHGNNSAQATLPSLAKQRRGIFMCLGQLPQDDPPSGVRPSPSIQGSCQTPPLRAHTTKNSANKTRKRGHPTAHQCRNRMGPHRPVPKPR